MGGGAIETCFIVLRRLFDEGGLLSDLLSGLRVLGRDDGGEEGAGGGLSMGVGAV